jgi:uncharacterized integral membrane protein
VADAQATRRGGSLGFVVGLVIGVPATIFALSNLESVQVEFAGWTASTPLWVVIILSLLAGALIGCAVLLAWQARRRRTRKKAARGRRGDSAPEPPATPDAAEPAGSSEPAPSRRAGKPERPAASGSGSAADQS